MCHYAVIYSNSGKKDCYDTIAQGSLHPSHLERTRENSLAASFGLSRKSGIVGETYMRAGYGQGMKRAQFASVKNNKQESEDLEACCRSEQGENKKRGCDGLHARDKNDKSRFCYKCERS